MALYNYLRTAGIGEKPVIIGIDGMLGIGKSTLAYCIGCNFKVPVINIDHFVGEITESYKNAVAFQVMSCTITRYKNMHRTLVIEGICLLEILKELNITPDILIYYKVLDSRGEWIDEEVCGCMSDKVVMSALPPLRKNIAKYHNDFHPLEKADCIVFRSNISNTNNQNI